MFWFLAFGSFADVSVSSPFSVANLPNQSRFGFLVILTSLDFFGIRNFIEEWYEMYNSANMFLAWVTSIMKNVN